MKAKYILRGLGLGMIITAVVMGAYTRSAVADARVAVLKEYGIGEEATLAETLVDVGDSKDNEADNGVKPSENVAVKESGVDEGMAPVTAPYNEELESEIQSVLDAAEAAEQSMQDDVSDVVSGAVVGDDLGSQQGGNAGGLFHQQAQGADEKDRHVSFEKRARGYDRPVFGEEGCPLRCPRWSGRV